jgi:hypothetical protein
MSKKTLNQQLVFALQTTMGLAYVGGGLFLVASSLTYGFLPTGTIRYTIGSLILVYGIFRVYRAIQLWKE